MLYIVLFWLLKKWFIFFCLKEIKGLTTDHSGQFGMENMTYSMLKRERKGKNLLTYSLTLNYELWGDTGMY